MRRLRNLIANRYFGIENSADMSTMAEGVLNEAILYLFGKF